MAELTVQAAYETVRRATLPPSAELEPLCELHDKVVAQMKAHNVARQPWTKRKNG
ncbi:hypothetical protein ACWEKM_31900 [Streptomyces sp. NPDC004752]